MRLPFFFVRRRTTLILAVLLTFALVAVASAQSQEPKPSANATPASKTETPAAATPISGVTGSTWVGPSWSVAIAWDPAVWTVEGELIDAGYDGLQIGTTSSTVYVEAYDGFSGDAAACLDDAEGEIRARDGVSEVEVLTGRQLPQIDADAWPTRLFGLIAEQADGAPYRGVELVQCRAVVPGTAVLELTWQTAASTYNQELPLVDALFATLTVPNEITPQATPVSAATLEHQPHSGVIPSETGSA